MRYSKKYSTIARGIRQSSYSANQQFDEVFDESTIRQDFDESTNRQGIRRFNNSTRSSLRFSVIQRFDEVFNEIVDEVFDNSTIQHGI